MGGQQEYYDPESLERIRYGAINNMEKMKASAILSLFTSPDMSVKGYHFNSESDPKPITEPKEQEELERKWKYCKETKPVSMADGKRYLACMDLVAEVRYAAYSKCGAAPSGNVD